MIQHRLWEYSVRHARISIPLFILLIRKHPPYKTNVNNILQIFTIYLTQLIDKICEATKDKKQYIQMATFISLVTTSLKPPFYNDIIKIIPNPTKKGDMLLKSW